jgi:hypothetical protein
VVSGLGGSRVDRVEEEVTDGAAKGGGPRVDGLGSGGRPNGG